MNYDEKLLIEIHKSADMGRSTLLKLAPHIQDSEFKSLVDTQREDYNRVFIAAGAKLKAVQNNNAGAPRTAVAMGGMMADMRAAANNDPEYLADVILRGIDTGIKDINAALREYGDGATPETVRLATTFREHLVKGRAAFERYLPESGASC